MLLVLLGFGGFILYRRGQVDARKERAHSPTEASSAPNSPANDNSGVAPGQPVVNEHRALDEGQSVTYTVPAGHYRVRVTSNRHGIKAYWKGVECVGTSKEATDYRALCDPAAEVHFVIENPTTFGFGGAEQVTINVTTN